MIKPNIENSKSQLLANQKSHSNTPLFLHLPLTLSTNSFNPWYTSKYDSHFSNCSLLIHLDYLRVSTTNLSKRTLNILVDYLFSEVDSKTINKRWHPHPRMPRSKKYDYRIISKTGIVLGVRKRAKYKGVNRRYAYDIMIDFTGAYFTDLDLLEQVNLINYLNTNYKLECHRLDVAIDDYSRELFPVGQMITAYLEDNQFGFEVIDDSYLDIVNNKLIGTLGIGSRRSAFFVRIYTKRNKLVRWETELKQNKAQALFNKLAGLSTDKEDGSLPVHMIQKALLDAALGEIDFRNKSRSGSLKNATRERTNRLPFWQSTLDKLYSLIESIADSNTARSITV